MSDINELISKEALDSVTKLQTTFASIVTTLDQLVAKSKTLDQLLSSMNKAADAENQIGKAAKESALLNKQLRDSEDEVVKAKIRYRDANKELQKEMQNQLAMEKAAADSMVAMKIKLSELKDEYNKASSAVREQLAPEVKKLTDQISKAEQAIGVHSRGVGNYAQNILNAAKQLFSFGGIAAIAMAAVNKLKEAFESTAEGMTLMSQAQQISKQLFSDLIALEGINIQHLKEAANIGRQLANLHMDEYKINYDIKGVEKERDELRLKAADQTRLLGDRLALLTQVEEKEKQVVEMKLEPMREELLLINQQIELRPKDIKLQEQGYELMSRMRDVQDEYATSMKRIESQRTGDIKKEAEDRKKEHDDLMKLADEQIEEDEKVYLENQKLAKQESDNFEAEKKEISDAFEREVDSVNKHIQLEQKKTDAKIKLEESTLKFSKEVAKKNNQIIKDNLEAQQEELKGFEYTETAKLNIAKDSVNFFNAIAGKNKELQKAALIADKAVAVAEVIIQTEKANAAITAWGASYAIITAGASVAIAEGIRVKNRIAEYISIGAIIASISKFAKGTKSSPAGPAIVGELGSELIVSPSGKVSLSGDSAEIRTLERGTKIIPSDETKRIMNAARSSQRDNSDQIQERRHRELVKAIQDKDTLILSTEVGAPITRRKGNQYIKYFERHLS